MKLLLETNNVILNDLFPRKEKHVLPKPGSDSLLFATGSGLPTTVFLQYKMFLLSESFLWFNTELIVVYGLIGHSMCSACTWTRLTKNVLRRAEGEAFSEKNQFLQDFSGCPWSQPQLEATVLLLQACCEINLNDVETRSLVETYWLIWLKLHWYYFNDSFHRSTMQPRVNPPCIWV